MHEQRAQDILSSYELLAQVTARMREAAARDDWDSVLALETECAGLYSHLKATCDEAPHDAARQRRKSELICQVLEHDAQIREKLSGELVHIWRLMEGERHVSKLNSAYAAAAESR